MRPNRGFTLLELMITVAIVAILAAVALPSYREQIRKTHRADGRHALMQFATAQERFYTNCNGYAKTLNGAPGSCEGLGASAASVASEAGFYSISLESDGVTFTLTASPQHGQEDDLKCDALTLTDSGLKGATGTDPTECW